MKIYPQVIQGYNKISESILLKYFFTQEFAQQICLVKQPEEEEVEIAEQIKQVNGESYESAIDFVNQSFQMFDSSPMIKALAPDRIVKQGNLAKLTMILN